MSHWSSPLALADSGTIRLCSGIDGAWRCARQTRPAGLSHDTTQETQGTMGGQSRPRDVSTMSASLKLVRAARLPRTTAIHGCILKKGHDQTSDRICFSTSLELNPRPIEKGFKCGKHRSFGLFWARPPEKTNWQGSRTTPVRTASSGQHVSSGQISARKTGRQGVDREGRGRRSQQHETSKDVLKIV